ncbi:MAG: HAD family phosphatase [Aureispira sp.]|nr:HAD family phosphatase [Aureispira sp.]
MSKTIKAVIFDFDGTLVNSVEAYMQLFLELGERFGNRPITKDDFLILNGMAVQDALKLLVKEKLFKFRVIPYVIWNLRKFKRRIVEETAPYPHVHETLTLLKEQYKVALVTSNQRKHVDWLCSKYSLASYFLHSITEDDVKEHKPDPQPFLKMAELLSLAPEECLVIEDSPFGVLAAHRAGMHTCVVEHTTPQKYFKEEKNSKPHQFIKNISLLDTQFIKKHFPNPHT